MINSTAVRVRCTMHEGRQQCTYPKFNHHAEDFLYTFLPKGGDNKSQ